MKIETKKPFETKRAAVACVPAAAWTTDIGIRREVGKEEVCLEHASRLIEQQHKPTQCRRYRGRSGRERRRRCRKLVGREQRVHRDMSGRRRQLRLGR